MYKPSFVFCGPSLIWMELKLQFISRIHFLAVYFWAQVPFGELSNFKPISILKPVIDDQRSKVHALD